MGATRREVQARLADVRRTFAYAGSATAWIEEWGSRWLHGTPSEVAEQLGAFAENGAERIIFQDFLFDDRDMIEMLGRWAKEDRWIQAGAAARLT